MKSLIIVPAYNEGENMLKQSTFMESQGHRRKNEIYD